MLFRLHDQYAKYKSQTLVSKLHQQLDNSCMMDDENSILRKVRCTIIHFSKPTYQVLHLQWLVCIFHHRQKYFLPNKYIHGSVRWQLLFYQ